jgi:hypothetical protein
VDKMIEVLFLLLIAVPLWVYVIMSSLERNEQSRFLPMNDGFWIKSFEEDNKWNNSVYIQLEIISNNLSNENRKYKWKA